MVRGFHFAKARHGTVTARTVAAALIWLACLGTTAVAVADSIIAKHSDNGGFMSMDVTLGFSGPGSALVIHSPAGFAPVLPPPSPPIIDLAPGIFTEFPPLGDPKDIAEIIPKMSFAYGAPVGTGDDSLTFDLEGDISALDARTIVGDPLNAEVHFKGTFEFFLDDLFAPAGTFVGELQFDPLGALDPFEALNVTILEFVGPTPTVLVNVNGAVGAPVNVGPAQLFIDRFYRIEYSYSAFVPFGVDPHFKTLDGVHFTPIPLPGSMLFLAPAVLLLTGLRRRP